MKDKTYYFQLFDEMGINYDELPESYSPDSYARSLLSKESKRSEISYAASTTIIIDGETQDTEFD